MADTPARTKIVVSALGRNPDAGEWGPFGREPETLSYIWESGDSDAELTRVVGEVQGLMTARGYTQFTVREVPE